MAARVSTALARVVTTGAKLLAHKIRTRVAIADIRFLIEVEDYADRATERFTDLSTWAFDRRMRRHDWLYGDTARNALRFTIGQNRMMNMRVVPLIPDSPGSYVNLAGIKSLSVEVDETDETPSHPIIRWSKPLSSNDAQERHTSTESDWGFRTGE